MGKKREAFDPSAYGETPKKKETKSKAKISRPKVSKPKKTRESFVEEPVIEEKIEEITEEVIIEEPEVEEIEEEIEEIEEIEEELDDYEVKPRRRKKNGKKGIIIGVIAVILVIGLGVGGIFAKKQHDLKSMETEAQNFVEIEDYTQAIAIYSQLYAKTGDEKYKSLKEQTSLKKDVLSNMETAESKHEQGEDIEALRIYMKIPPESKTNYEKAQENISEIKGQLMNKIKSLYDTKEYISARKLANDLLSVYPNNIDATTIANKCTEQIEKEKKEEERKEKEAANRGQQPNIYINNPKEDSGSTSSGRHSGLVGTYQTIYARKANIRSGPSKGSSSIGILSRGDVVYVDDIHVESSARTWCHTSRGWVSYNTINGTIK